jgi:hypothetical protein
MGDHIMPSIIRATTTSGLQVAPDNSGSLALQTNGTTTAVTIDTSQNVGIGTSSPNFRIQLNSPSVNTAQYVQMTNGSTGSTSADGMLVGVDSTNEAIVWMQESSALKFATASTERMRIDSSGNLLVGTTIVDPTTDAFSFQPANKYGCFSHVTGTSSGTGYVFFRLATASIGSITQNGTTAVLYNTTSDYRLKSDIKPIKNALTIIETLNPVSFTWIDNRKDNGFIAHELQKVLPNCVTGEKDDVNEDGTPKYQQMDNSGVIPFLVKAIQEQQTIINDLKARVETLEAK